MKIQAILLACLCLCAATHAAEGPELSASFGFVKGYLDEPAMLAGSAAIRIHLIDRVSVRPEFAIGGDGRFQNRYFLVSGIYDIRDPRRSAVPYLIGGGGYVVERDKRFSPTYK